MPVLKKSEKSVARLFEKVEEGVLLTQEEQENYEYISLTGAQLKAVSIGIFEAIETYRRIGETAAAAIQSAVKTQELFIERIGIIMEALSVFEKINVVFQLPKVYIPPPVSLPKIPTFDTIQPRPIRIFVEPEKPKALPDPRRKVLMPTNMVEVRNDGFIINEQPIKGFTRKSKVGKLFALLISNKSVSDEEMYAALEINDERTFSFIIRDLKDILLRKNKLELDIERYRSIKAYGVNGITKRIRKPKSIKKIVAKTKIN